eukprot:g13233.t1
MPVQNLFQATSDHAMPEPVPGYTRPCQSRAFPGYTRPCQSRTCSRLHQTMPFQNLFRATPDHTMPEPVPGYTRPYHARTCSRLHQTIPCLRVLLWASQAGQLCSHPASEDTAAVDPSEVTFLPKR